MNRQHGSNAYRWERLDALKDASLENAIVAIRSILASTPATLDQDPDWLEAKAKSPDRATRTYICRNRLGTVVGFAPFLLHPSSLEFAFGPLRFARIAFRRVSLTTGPLFSEDVLESGAACASLIDAAMRDLEGREVLFVLGMPLASPLASILDELQAFKKVLLLRHGPSYERRLAKVPRSLDEYLAMLGSRTRQDLRRQERRLVEEAGGTLTLAVYCDPSSVDDFVVDAERVSTLTYQWAMIGQGVASNEATKDLLRSAATSGWFRGYILHARGQPVAFMLGFLYGGNYLSETIGYDPRWARWSVGNILHMNVMRDLASLSGSATWFDFLYGDNANKERLSTDSHSEQNCYLLPRTTYWKMFLLSWNGFNRVTSSLSRFMSRYRIRDRVLSVLRRRASARALEQKAGLANRKKS